MRRLREDASAGTVPGGAALTGLPAAMLSPVARTGATRRLRENVSAGTAPGGATLTGLHAAMLSPRSPDRRHAPPPGKCIGWHGSRWRYADRATCRDVVAP
ncbi:hypothetical protein QFI96_025420 [Raoultella sp. TW_WC1a-1]|uniref:Uncharacterized protein n=1 Tax=Raoultella lignicola TaxID=3040939 RepID=A0ABU9FGH7_9ENTR